MHHLPCSGCGTLTQNCPRRPVCQGANRWTQDQTPLYLSKYKSLDVVKIINDCDCKKAQGYNRMPMKMLQKSAKYIITPAIANIINDSLSKCVFPDSLKFAEVSSLLKKKDTLIKTNYRPVSILVALSKIYEKARWPYFNSIFFQIHFQLFERIVSQPYYIWLKILKML